MRGRKIKISDNAIKGMMDEGLRNKQIIEKAECDSYTPVYNALKRNNLVRKKGRPKTVDREKLIELHEKGEHTAKEIAVELNCSVDRVYKLIKEHENGLIYNELIERGLIKK